MDIGGEGDLPDLLGHNDGDQDLIGDVLEAIERIEVPFGGPVVEPAMARAPQPQGAPFARLVEQPASKALRFRYECEGRSAGSIPGVNSTPERKTFPALEIGNHAGKAIIVVSCVTRDPPYKPHPHKIVGRTDRCSRGVCTQKVEVGPDNSVVTFSNLGIQCVKRRDIGDALQEREALRIDPFRTGYAHRNQPQSIDLNSVRLCFQVFIPDEAGKVRHSLPPVVSEVIYDKKAMSDLQILRLSSSAAAAKGGTDLILLCEKVTREDIAVVFYEERREVGAGGGGGVAVVWEEPANIVLVHKQFAIAFTAPPYRDKNITDPVKVFIQLKRPSDGARSVGVSFMYSPAESNYLEHKRKKPLHSSLIHQIEQQKGLYLLQEQKPIKAEPSDKSTMHVDGSPHRHYTALDQASWLDPALALGEPGGALQYYQEAQWGQQYQQVLQVTNMGGPSRSPMHANLPATSPNVHAMSPNIQVMSPNMQVMSPQHQQVMSPQHQQVMSPQHQQVMSPQHQQVMSPQHQQMMSPQHQQVMSPQHQQVMSPQHQQVMSPQHQQVMSPQHQQVMSPQHHLAVSPGLQAMSPQHMLDERQAGMGHVSPSMGHVSPNMGHVSPSMGHVSPNLVQQQMAQHQQQPLPMQQESSSPSLSGLLSMAADEPPVLNSGDLRDLNTLFNQIPMNESSTY